MAKVGDLVRIVGGDGTFFNEGTRARITEFDKDGDAWGDFRELGNPEGSFDPDCDGTWCLGAGRRFEVVPEGE